MTNQCLIRDASRPHRRSREPHDPDSRDTRCPIRPRARPRDPDAAHGLACIAAHFASTFGAIIATFALFGAAWATALVNLMPMALELGGVRRAATFAAIFLFCQYVAGMLGPLLCGAAFDATGDRRLLFALLAAFLVVSAALAASLRRGLGETRDEGVRSGDTGRDLVT
jgi:hypothetical protein